MNQQHELKRLQVPCLGGKSFEFGVRGSCDIARTARNHPHATPAEFPNFFRYVRLNRGGKLIRKISNGMHHRAKAVISIAELRRFCAVNRPASANRKPFTN